MATSDITRSAHDTVKKMSTTIHGHWPHPFSTEIYADYATAFSSWRTCQQRRKWRLYRHQYTWITMASGISWNIPGPRPHPQIHTNDLLWASMSRADTVDRLIDWFNSTSEHFHSMCTDTLYHKSRDQVIPNAYGIYDRANIDLLDNLRYLPQSRYIW